jgi:hypothetical protein
MVTSQKHPKHVFFMPKNASKNRIFGPFFAKNGQNLHFSTQKTGEKTAKTTLFYQC